jgi:predicted phosphodiesterase
MIYVTGDTHGDYSRFSSKNFPEQRTMTKSDFVLVLGDFGIWADSPEQRWNLRWLDAKPFTTLFIDGNHENFDLLNSYPVVELYGGLAHQISDSIYHLKRGELFDLYGKTFFVMGGASSHDISDGILESSDPDLHWKMYSLRRQNKTMFRVKGKSWWPEELPSEEEYRHARNSLEDRDWKADIILSHCGPSSVIYRMSNGDYGADRLTDFLDEIDSKVPFKHWFFGHYHRNEKVDEKHICLYEQIVKLD